MQKNESGINIKLPYRPPYAWNHLRDFFLKREVQGSEKISESSIAKALEIDGVALSFVAQHVPHSNRFDVTFSDSVSPVLIKAINAVKKILDIDSVPDAISLALVDAGLKTDEIIQGMRIPGLTSRFEAGCRAILGQQVTVTSAVKQVNLLQHELRGEPSEQLRPFVTPEQVASADLSFLRMPQARKQSLKDFARHYLEFPDSMPNTWLAIKGIGPWTVNYVNMRTQAVPDIFLDSDLIIRQQIKKLSEQGRSLVHENAAPWRTYLTMQLWEMSA